MKIFKLMLAGILITAASNSYAQYSADALRFSQTNYGSSARFKGMGNAQIGVGGDLSSLGGNPAGLGLFTKSEISITPEFNGVGMDASYLGKNTNTNKNQLNLNQFAAAFYTPIYKRSGQNTNKGAISAVFGLGYNRNNDYSADINYGGTNNRNSAADYFAELAGSQIPSALASGSLERMAYDNYLISYDAAAQNYFPETFADANNGNMQAQNTVRSGSVSEFTLAGALNVSNKVYIGASLGLVNLRYTTDAQFSEAGLAREYNSAGILTGANTPYKFLYNQNQITKGSGVNGRLGIIYRPTPELRLGANFQTPTWFTIDDTYTEGLDNRGTARGRSDSQDYPFSYNLRTPLKGSFGASYILGGRALISGDVDFVDYSSIRFSDNDGYTGASQTVIDNNKTVTGTYSSAINYRVGAEVKLNELFSLRGGFGVNGSPMKNDNDHFFDSEVYSGGLGYRTKNYYFDLAYQRFQANATLSPYVLNNLEEPIATVKNATNNVFLTFGLRF